MARLKEVLFGDFKTVGLDWQYLSMLQQQPGMSYKYFMFIFEDFDPAVDDFKYDNLSFHVGLKKYHQSIEIEMSFDSTGIVQDIPGEFKTIGYYTIPVDIDVRALNIRKIDYSMPAPWEMTVSDFEKPLAVIEPLNLSINQPYALDYNVREFVSKLREEQQKLSIYMYNIPDASFYGVGAKGNDFGLLWSYEERLGGLYPSDSGSGSTLIMPANPSYTVSVNFDEGGGVGDELVLKTWNEARCTPFDATTYFGVINENRLTEEEKHTGSFILSRTETELKIKEALQGRTSKKLESEFGAGDSEVIINTGVTNEKVVSFTVKVICNDGVVTWENDNDIIRKFVVKWQSGDITIMKTQDATELDLAKIVIYIEEEV